MSYILEALKKAQAERQIGNAPTIHAPPVAAPVPSGGAASRKPLLIGLGAGALVVAAGALWLGRPAPQAVAQAPDVPVVRPAAPAPASAPAPALEVSAPPAPPARVPEHVPARAPEPMPAAAPPAPSRPAPAARPALPAPEARPATPMLTQTHRPAPAPAAMPAPEDSLPFLQQLPDAQQRDIPRVTFGGYMYSSNPADRLLIVDKALRHEGEEVAPGLVLEKLLPKAAVMNFRGTRYRVPY